LEGPEFAQQTQVQTNELMATSLNSANVDVFDFSNQLPQSLPNLVDLIDLPDIEPQQGHQDWFPVNYSYSFYKCYIILSYS
jgi:hypothetical protein